MSLFFTIIDFENLNVDWVYLFNILSLFEPGCINLEISSLEKIRHIFLDEVL